MSSEVCPYCGKTYKRLKTHLPHCKAAASSKTPPTKHDVTVNQTSSSQLGAASMQVVSVAAKKSRKKPAVSSSPQTPSQSAGTPPSLSLSSESPPPATKKKKQQLSKQIKTATIPPVSAQSQSPSLPPAASTPKKKSLRALIEAAKSKQVPATQDLPSGSAPFVADPQTQTKTNPDTELVKDNAHPAFLSSDTKPKSSSKMKATKAKKVAQTLSSTKDTSSSLDSKENQSGTRRNDSLIDDKEEFDDLSVNNVFLKSGSAHQARITLQDVKATLGRAHSSRQSSILNQIRTTEDPRPGTSPRSQSQDGDSCWVTTKSLSSSSSQQTELQSVKTRNSKPKQASLIPLDGSPQSELPSPTHPHLLSQVSQAKFPLQSMSEGLKVAGLPTVSPPLTQFSSPHLFPLAPPRVETPRRDDGLMKEKSQLWTDPGSKGVLTQRRLGQVRLRELPEWLACKTPSHPRDMVEMVQRGWQWYYRRYIDVKKGGVGGLGMLLAGYCVLSYTWSYPHLKRDRWRKHH
ncbi:uncharacterized protein C17orf80 homolog [Acanthopagrus latus]|uniref:uncharacterized protein C17orf80 homolog n=1 Tax=Acanthopagrus latus TaxID=8177 RepID=UPI00187BDABD|nr:uncharacterized protein C17orf80 homolog [Acanthopagrus latus]